VEEIQPDLELKKQWCRELNIPIEKDVDLTIDQLEKLRDKMQKIKETIKTEKEKINDIPF